MTAERYVATEALRQAIRGREAEVLRALGIEWKKGTRTSRCPYPDHADQNPSWRWDERKARAYCTCIAAVGTRSSTSSCACEGIEFEAAKLRVAEILGRSDLIKVERRTAQRDGRRQPAPATGRVSATTISVRSYLAYRLDVPPEQVPMPSTPSSAGASSPTTIRRRGSGGKPQAGRPALPVRGVRRRWRRTGGATPIGSMSRTTGRARLSWEPMPAAGDAIRRSRRV